MIHEQALLAVTGELASGTVTGAPILKSPGLLLKHYSPRATLVIWSWRDEEELKIRSAECGVRSANIHVITHTQIPSKNYFGRVSVLAHDARVFARALYAELHRCDDAGAELIIVEAPPASMEWRGVADRLTRAAGGAAKE